MFCIIYRKGHVKVYNNARMQIHEEFLIHEPSMSLLLKAYGTVKCLYGTTKQRLIDTEGAETSYEAITFGSCTDVFYHMLWTR